MHLAESLRIQPNDVIAFVGGGGKTSALFRLADELAARGKRVVATTTTHLGIPQIRDRAPLRFDPAPDFFARVRAALNTPAPVLIVGADTADGKVTGVPPEFIDTLAAHHLADAIVYEADGARGLPFKTPAPHEPVIAAATTVLVPVIGITALGAPLDATHAHRAERIAALAGARLGEPITPAIAARVLTAPDGGLKHKPGSARAVVLINQVETEPQFTAARQLARSLLHRAEIQAVALAALRAAPNPVHETQRRVAAIILAAGAGTRMQGHIKQLLAWRGKTLIENALDLASRSQAHETLVVLGAHAEQILPVVAGCAARVVLNPGWARGHATSLRAGLDALAPEISAALFLNADQPLLTPAVLDAIQQRYFETDAAIIAAMFAGRRGNPVLFDRAHFAELARLTGEQGGRELLARHPVTHVEFADARLGTDVDTLAEYAALREQDQEGQPDREQAN